MDSVILGAARLLDPAANRNNQNASLEWLEQLIQIEGDEDFARELQGLRNELINSFENLRKTRRKRIAHSDRSQARKKKLYPFPFSRMKIRKIYRGIGVYLNKISEFYTETSIRFDLTDSGDAESLLHKIAESCRYEELIEKGSIDRLDKLNNKWIKAIGQDLQSLDDADE